jgi:prophage DNA circulation protein
MQTASWDGMPFCVRESSIIPGRKTAVHDYPNRDVVWVEDLGQRARIYAFRGFLVGDDVLTQQLNFVGAAEIAGPKPLVHPSIGTVQVTLLHLVASQRNELGRVVELDFEFVTTTTAGPLYPSTAVATPAVTATTATAAVTATGSDFGSEIVAAAKSGAQVVTQVATTVSKYAGYAQKIMGDAGMAVGAVAGLASVGSNLGRFANGARTTLQGANATVATVLSGTVAARSAVTQGAAGLQSLVNAL